MSTYARTWIFLFGLLMIICGLGYGVLGSPEAKIVGMEHQGFTMVCGSPFWENPNAHAGDRHSSTYRTADNPDPDPWIAAKNTEQQRRCDAARAGGMEGVRNTIAFGAFCLFFPLLFNPFSRRRSGKVDFIEFDNVTQQARADVEARKKARADRLPPPNPMNTWEQS